ncbi:MAG: hypothetical protein ABW179_03745, partial [Methylobacterium sp.]
RDRKVPPFFVMSGEHRKCAASNVQVTSHPMTGIRRKGLRGCLSALFAYEPGEPLPELTSFVAWTPRAIASAC